MPLTQETSLRTTRFEKKNQEEKKEEERIAKKATDTNQQLYQKNYRSGPKDKCSETKKGKTKRNIILRRRLSRKDSKTKCKLRKEFLGKCIIKMHNIGNESFLLLAKVI